MQLHEDVPVRALTDSEVDGVSGANILIYGGPVVAGFLVGTGIRMAADALVDWLFD
jgi:hypothetical protein